MTPASAARATPFYLGNSSCYETQTQPVQQFDQSAHLHAHWPASGVATICAGRPAALPPHTFTPTGPRCQPSPPPPTSRAPVRPNQLATKRRSLRSTSRATPRTFLHSTSKPESQGGPCTRPQARASRPSSGAARTPRSSRGLHHSRAASHRSRRHSRRSCPSASCRTTAPLTAFSPRQRRRPRAVLTQAPCRAGPYCTDGVLHSPVFACRT